MFWVVTQTHEQVSYRSKRIVWCVLVVLSTLKDFNDYISGWNKFEVGKVFRSLFKRRHLIITTTGYTFNLLHKWKIKISQFIAEVFLLCYKIQGGLFMSQFWAGFPLSLIGCCDKLAPSHIIITLIASHSFTSKKRIY
uniref:Uncharacterized protein n=1 Tax=Lepeophtheirus salmonis TaxID=72036 RepID=A0A0K2SZK9_LEPSM